MDYWLANHLLLQIDTILAKLKFYHFHKDGMGDHLSVYDIPDKEFMHGRVRKLSMTVLLNANYEGVNFSLLLMEKKNVELIHQNLIKQDRLLCFLLTWNIGLHL